MVGSKWYLYERLSIEVNCPGNGNGKGTNKRMEFVPTLPYPVYYLARLGPGPSPDMTSWCSYDAPDPGLGNGNRGPTMIGQ